MSAEVRLHSEGCRRRDMSRKEPERTTSGVVPFGGMLKPCDRRRGPHTRDCEECDVARSNGEHRGPREAQMNKVIEEHTKLTENLHSQDKARERRQESEGGSRQ